MGMLARPVTSPPLLASDPSRSPAWILSVGAVLPAVQRATPHSGPLLVHRVTAPACIAERSGRDTDDERVRGDVTRDKSPGPDLGPLTDRHPGEHDRSRTDRGTVLHADPPELPVLVTLLDALGSDSAREPIVRQAHHRANEDAIGEGGPPIKKSVVLDLDVVPNDNITIDVHTLCQDAPGPDPGALTDLCVMPHESLLAYPRVGRDLRCLVDHPHGAGESTGAFRRYTLAASLYGSSRPPSMKPRLRNPIPTGSLAVGWGVVVYGLTAYGFLIVGARTMGPERYSGLAVFWAIVYLLGPGLFLPLEQEVARGVAARRATGVGALPLVRRAMVFGGAVVLVLIAGGIVFRATLVERLFDGEVLLAVGLVIGLTGYAIQHVTRGVVAGGGRFGAYGFVLGTEGILRLLAALLLAALGVAVAGPFGLAVGLAPLISVAAGVRPAARIVEPGPEAHWGELSRALGYLLTSSLLAQYLAIAAPIAVKLLAEPGRGVVAGHLMASLVMVRVPLFLFQAVQPPLLARLSSLAGAGRTAELRRMLWRLGAGLSVAVVGTLLGTVLMGQWAVSTFFGEAFALPRADLVMLAGGTAALIVAMALAQALIALSLHARLALSWLLGAVVFTAATALGSELLPRVERAFVLGPFVASSAMLVFLAAWSRTTTRRGEAEPEIVAPIPVEP